MTYSKKLGLSLGTKINSGGSSPGTTVSQLQDYLGSLKNGFDALKKAAEPAASEVQKLSTSMQKITEATTNIVKFSEDLSKKLKDIQTKDKKGKLNADSTVFSSFSDLVDLVTASVTPTKIAKFETISKSLRSFTLSLNDMISISKSFTKINKFVTDLNTPATKGGKDSPFAKLVTVIGSYVNTFGELGGRSQEISKGKDNVEKTKNIINPTIQGIKDIFATIKDLTQDLSGLLSNDVQAGLNTLTTIKDRLIAFFTRIGDFAIIGTDTKSSGKIVPILNQKIQGFNLLVDSLKQLSNVLSKLSTVNEARDKLIATRDAIIDFIKGFFIQEETIPMVVDDKSNLSVYKPVLDNLQNGINNLSAITGLLLKLADALPKVSLVKESRDRLKETQQAIIDFVRGFYTGGSEESLVVYTGNQNYVPFLDSLKNGFTVMKSITDVFSKLSFSMPKLTLVQKAREDFIATRKAITDFVKGFFFEGDASLDADQSNKFKIYLVSLKNGLTIMSAITDVITKLASSVPKLAMVEEARNNLKATRQAILDFVKGFFFEGDISAPLDAANTEKYKTFLASIQSGLQFMNAILKPLSKYASVLSSLKKIGSINTVDWYSTKGSLFEFIKGFIPDDAMSAEQLGKGLSVLDAVSKVVRKYTNVVNALSNIGSVNTIDWESTKKSLILFLQSFVNDPDLERLSQDAVKRFSTLSNSLRGIATFINSIGKNKIGEGLTKLEGAKDKIKQFIESMAELKNNTAFPDFERVANAVGSFNGRLHDATKTVERSNQSFTKLKSILRQIYTAFVGGAVIYSIVRSIKSAVKEIFNLEYAMARVNTIARVSSNELKNMTHFVQDISATYGIASSKVSKALYDINSATIKGASSLKILEQSAKLAVAGFTDIEKVTSLITRAVNAYEYSASEAAKISDILFVTVERGINPMEELSEYMGRLFTVAANAGVSLEEVGAGLATLTARGYQTNVASTALNSAILKLSTGTKELNKLFQQNGYASSASALRIVGLSGALQILNKATGGATDKLHDLGFNYRDIRAATTLASGAIYDYNKTLAMMNDENYKAGLTEKAKAEVMDTVRFKLDKLKETYTVFIQSISEYLNKNETIKKFLSALTTGIENLTKVMQGENLTTGEQFGVGLITAIPKFIIFAGVLSLITKVTGLMSGSFKIAHQEALKTTFVMTKFFNTKGIKGFGSFFTVTFRGITRSIRSSLNAIKEFSINAGRGLFRSVSHPINNLTSLFSKLFTSIKSSGTLFPAFFKSISVGVGTIVRLSATIGTLLLQTKALESIFKLVSDFNYVRENLTFEEFLDSYGQNVWNTLRGFAAGGAGRFIDFFAGTNFGEKWSANFLPPAHNFNFTAEGESEKQGKWRRELTRSVNELRNLDLFGIGFNESEIDSKFDKLYESLHKLAENSGISEEWFRQNVKNLVDEKEKILQLNTSFKKLLPNTIALNDTFEEVSKKMKESYEKHLNPLEKTALQYARVSLNVSQVAKSLSLSEEQVKAAFFNEDGGAEFLKEAQKRRDRQISKAFDVLQFKDTQVDFGKYIEDQIRKNDLVEKLKRSKYVRKNFNLDEDDSSFTEGVVKDLILDDSIRSKLATDIRLDKPTRSLLAGIESNYQLEQSRKVYNDNADYIKSLNRAVSSGIDSLPEDMKSVLQSKLRQISKFINDNLDRIKENPKLLFAYIAELVKGSNSLVSNLDYLSETFLENQKNIESFRKSLRDVGLSIQELSAIDVNIKDVIDNTFGIAPVSEIQDSMKALLYGPEGILKVDEQNFNNLMEVVSGGLRENKSFLDITASLYDLLEEEALFMDQFVDLQYTNPDEANKQKFDRISQFVIRVSSMFSYYSDFMKELSELDYMKFMNRLRFGSEPSAFKQYIKIDKKRIDDLMKTTIYGKNGISAQFIEALNQFNADYVAGGGDFVEAMNNFINKFGDTAWTTFVKLFKQYEQLDKGSSNALRTEFKNIRKRVNSFVKNYEDALLSPIQRLYKVQDRLQRQLSKLKRQQERGNVNPELVNKILDNYEELQKLNEETMNIKVPAAITASEAVRTGSKEAFDLVARNVFKDTYKVNLRQEKLQKDIVTAVKDIGKSIANRPEAIPLTLP